MQAVNFEEVLEKILVADPRYARDAYLFLREALDHTQKITARQRKAAKEPAARHVTGKELLDGIRDYALQQFGPMTRSVLAEWGIRRCEDFGELVFIMVDHRLLGKTEKDTREDFKGGYDFEEAFVKPFRPAPKKKDDEQKPAKA
ncbi:MAG: hypothetical protein HY301_06420 [Verrucomicrobia bacterium]|nr:hypothetical protein [Verrucomicrobiota bacterium]